MSYIFKFDYNDILINSIKAYPDITFDIYGPTAYYNNRIPLSGAFTGSVLSCAPGYISLYEMNIDRSGAAGLQKALPTQADGSPGLPPFEAAVKGGVNPSRFYTDGRPGGRIAGNPLIRPFIVKDGSRMGYKTVSKATFNAERIGQVMSTHYPLTASITKEYWKASDSRTGLPAVAPATDGAAAEVTDSGSVSHLIALINTMNYYQKLSPHYAVSSSKWSTGVSGVDSYVGPGRNLTGSSQAQAVPAGEASDPGKAYETVDPGACAVGLISIPSIFYGSTIKKGSVILKTYISGTLAAQLQDINRNGELIQTLPVGHTNSGSVAGVVLYNEGFVVLTGSWDIGAHKEDYLGEGRETSKWIYFAQSLSAYLGGTTMSSSYYLGFKGTTITPTMTMFAHAKKNELNHSNNPTYVSSTETRVVSTGSQGYYENDKLSIKNTVSSSYNDPTGSFVKTTYINKISIYDENHNLLGVAKLAKPVRKLEDRAITFKLKLDI